MRAATFSAGSLEKISLRISNPGLPDRIVSRSTDPSAVKRAVTRIFALSTLIFIISPYREICVSSQKATDKAK
jgi:hypothetical protein